VAPTPYSVIIYGETGCGKEAFAQEIHNAANAAVNHLWPLTAEPYRRSWLQANCLVMKRVLYRRCQSEDRLF